MMHQRPPTSPHAFGFRPTDSPLRSSRKRKPSWDDDAGSPVMSGLGSPFSPLTPSKRFRTGPLDQTLFQRLQAMHNSHEQQQVQPKEPQQQNIPLPVERLLSSLTKDQLVGIISSLIQKHPVLQSEVSELVPRPTLASVAALLNQAEKSLVEAFPYSKLGPERSDYAFNRVRPQLQEVLQLIMHYLDHFVRSDSYPSSMHHDYPATAFGYLHLATALTHRLPVWQNDIHNEETKGQLYARLGNGWRAAVTEVGKFVKEGKVYGAAAVGEWARNLHQHSAEVKGAYGFGEAFEEFKSHLGWLIGLYPAGEDSSGAQGPMTLSGAYFAAFPMAAVG
ncbi:uncharacterized protein SPPG_03649 [Spizellomyces punctatus DAOM BR117]|uniref:Tethering factor for nuclear proteasome STS1 n=1 Tax=Spizellomyces punctatus (strain DAOM BR117) TaxID=645134 RepID=A0A0L0HM11_SPIPD|nr:uncharacterized protein SPPG_03649 [Spizellomyces punctatus DAOM BR117]KND01859.1 hypothetical protein SPPG_03649 [Spizellomyces punctatus DAOM BR117]|eukprot:XP_016609898.1 hypothetical protein SPPG_03649 [Spizellomyces punctatus DAOM BR117]